jgi:predicted choloylglycine hydrolase
MKAWGKEVSKIAKKALILRTHKQSQMHRIKVFLFSFFISIYTLLVIGLIFFQLNVSQSNPMVQKIALEQQERQEISKDHYRLANNWLKKNQWGVWEMYLEGSGYERGIAQGKLAKELIDYQEKVFVDKLKQLIPSTNYLSLLKGLIAWFNRDMESYIPQEYREEIYGISKSASTEFNYIGPAYGRMLNYHAAHDIGHALQNLALVGCTSFGVNQKDENADFLLGRNFDFYVSDDFAKNKMVIHVKPDQGYEFTFVSWASFIGVVSGMNEKGITVSINAAKSTYPSRSAMPISLLAREILQYAATFDEAIAIAHRRQLFVSESIHLGSAAEKTSIIIEKNPDTMAIYRSQTTSLICANHFQSDLLASQVIHQQDKADSPSDYRYRRCKELIDNSVILDVNRTAEILRDMNGLHDKAIGYGNEKAMNQLISHHSVIFEPAKNLMWVSTSPYQLGRYLAYNTTLFGQDSESSTQSIDSLQIAASAFLQTKEFEQAMHFKKLKAQIQTALFKGTPLKNIDQIEREIILSNPRYYMSYMLIGDYFYQQGNFAKAKHYYQESLKYEIENQSNQEQIVNRIAKMNQA